MNSFEYDCPRCNNTGYIQGYYNENGTFCEFTNDTQMFEFVPVTRECKCHRYRENIKRLKRSGLYRVIEEKTFDTYVTKNQWQKQIKDKAVQYSKSPKGWFFIGGQVGSGKTHLCTAICRELLMNGKTVKYMAWKEESTKLKAIINDADYGNKISLLKNTEVLYIDDLFKTDTRAEPSPADVSLAFEILDYRYKNNLLTILSGEKVLDELLKIDEGVGSRIYEMSKDYRLNLQKNQSRNYRLSR